MARSSWLPFGSGKQKFIGEHFTDAGSSWRLQRNVEDPTQFNINALMRTKPFYSEGKTVIDYSSISKDIQLSTKFTINPHCRNFWTQASSVVLDMARAPELAKFMGKPVPSYRQPGEVTKLSRDDLTVRDVVNLRAGDDKIVQGRSITARNRDLVNSGEWVVYDKNNEEHYGQLMAAYKIQPRSGQQITTKAKIFAANLEGDKKIDCPVIKKYSIIYIEGKDVIRKACVIHDCLGGGCRMAERMVEGRKEQEIVKSKKLCVKHNLDHENYIVNVFHLGH